MNQINQISKVNNNFKKIKNNFKNKICKKVAEIAINLMMNKTVCKNKALLMMEFLKMLKANNNKMI